MATASGALGVEAHLPRRQHASLDGVHLRDEIAIARQGDVTAPEQDLEID
jgi:hypothetical protein